MYKYKLKEGHTPDDTFLPGYGFSEEGFIESDTPIESPVLELVSAPQEVAAAPVAAPVPETPVVAQVIADNTTQTEEQ